MKYFIERTDAGRIKHLVYKIFTNYTFSSDKPCKPLRFSLIVARYHLRNNRSIKGRSTNYRIISTNEY